jgi:hypothetical protein
VVVRLLRVLDAVTLIRLILIGVVERLSTHLNILLLLVGAAVEGQVFRVLVVLVDF